MSLKNIHLAFVTMSAGLSVVVARWAWFDLGASRPTQGPIVAALAVASAVLLIAYGVGFQRRCRREGIA